MTAGEGGAAPTYLVGMDGSPPALAAARFAAGLAEAAGGELLLASVYDGGPAGVPVRDTEFAGARVEAHAAPSAERGLHELAEREAAALVAVGAAHRYGLGRLKPDGIVERLLCEADRPVLVVGDPVTPDGARVVHTVGVAHAGDAEGDEALSAATSLARDLDAQVQVVSVVEPGPAGVAALEERARRLRARAPAVRGLIGHAAPALMRAADHFDLLVLGSHRRGPAGRVLLGDVSRRVVAHARCPVLVVPRPATAPSG